MGVGDVVYHGAADVYRKINETGFSRPSDQSAAAFVVTHAWAVCLIGMMIVLFGMLITLAAITCQCMFDRKGACRESSCCCYCCCCSGGVADQHNDTKASSQEQKGNPPATQFMTA